VFRHDFNGGLFSRLCILLFSLGFGQDAVTERLDRSILRRDEKKASSSAHTRRSLLGVASSRATSRVASKRANSNEKNILLFDTHRDVLLHFVRVHLENNENRFRQSSLNRVERMHRTC
jgi:predicted secreted Zn-dependent protease